MTGNHIAIQRTITDAIDEYEKKRADISRAVKAYEDAKEYLGVVSSIWGVYGGSAIDGVSRVREEKLQNNLIKSAWRAVWARLNLDIIASARDKCRFENDVERAPEFTLDNIRASFGDYLLRSRHHILRGLAECFCELDRSYRSHNKVKIGTDGLPKRIIIRTVDPVVTGKNTGIAKITDVINALHAYEGLPLVEAHNVQRCIFRPEIIGKQIDGIEFRTFDNGNVHVHFSAEKLRSINLALAEFYGDVLPDTEDEDIAPQASKAVAKDLQFYPTPEKVADWLVNKINIADHAAVLEPSCGTGRLMDAVRRKTQSTTIFGVEVDPARARECRNRGYVVRTANFLEMTPDPHFDVVVMNPPFYGLHYLKHLRHAMEFLRPGGQLAAILPASAKYDNPKKLPHGRWIDLPVGSFSESGTNINTGMLFVRRGEQQ